MSTQSWRKHCQDRENIGKPGKSKSKKIGTSLHDHISRGRASITGMTSSWGDCSPGPLGINIPSGLMSETEVKRFNERHIGVAHAIISPTKSHFMVGQSWTRLLYELYTPAYDCQRRKYGLDINTRGKFLADAWTGFRSTTDGEGVERAAWSKLNGVEMPHLDCMQILFCVESIGF